MANTIPDSAQNGPRRPPKISRSRTASTKLTPQEYAEIERIADSRGQWLSEWVRDVILAAARGQEIQFATFTEVQSLRLLLINTLDPLLRGEKMSPEQFKEMLRYVKTNKRKAAVDVLASYAEGGTE